MAENLKELQDEATERGIGFDRRWGLKKLRKALSKSMACEVTCHAPDSPEVDDSHEDKKEDQLPLFTELDKKIAEDEIERECEDEIIKIKNISLNRYEIGNFVIDPSEVVELSASQKNNEYLMKRINRSIELKKFKLLK